MPLLEHSGLAADQLEQLRASAAHGPLLAALRDAEARGLDVDATFPKLVAARLLVDGDDPAAVLHCRVDRWVEAAGSRRQAATNLIAGLVPRAAGVTDPDMARALDDRDRAMQHRAAALAAQAIERGQMWGSPARLAASRTGRAPGVDGGCRNRRRLLGPVGDRQRPPPPRT